MAFLLATGEIRMLFEIISTVSSGLFAGAAIYVNLVEHPARVEFGIELALREFAPRLSKSDVVARNIGRHWFHVRRRRVVQRSFFMVVNRRYSPRLSYSFHPNNCFSYKQEIILSFFGPSV